MSAATTEAQTRRRIAAQERVAFAEDAIASAEFSLDEAMQALADVEGAALPYERVRAQRDLMRVLKRCVRELLRDPNLLLDHDPAESSR